MSRETSNLQFWERVAGLYTLCAEKKAKRMYEALCSEIRPFLTQSMHVLELACGTGQLTLPLCDCVDLWEATDFSKAMVDALRKRGKKSTLQYSVQDATCLTYADAQFDAVVLANALHIMPYPEQALAEVKRVLKQDGLFFVPTYVYDGKVDKFAIWLMERIGFQTFHKWHSEELKAFVQANGFLLLKALLLPGGILPECLLVCKKQSV